MTNQNCSISSKIYWPIRIVGALPLFSKLVSSCFTIMTHLLWVIFSLTYSPGHTFWINNFITFILHEKLQTNWYHLQLPKRIINLRPPTLCQAWYKSSYQQDCYIICLEFVIKFKHWSRIHIGLLNPLLLSNETYTV